MSTTHLLQALQLGTSRAAAPQDAMPEALAHLRATSIWEQFAALDLWQRAGHQLPPAAGVAALAPSADETRPLCGPHAQACLGVLLQGVYPELIGEWLALAERHGVRVPPRFLPKLLALAHSKPALRAPLAACMGERGHWLAQQGPGRSWVASRDAASDWDTGSIEERTAALRSMRASDPAAALASLAAVWKTEAPEHRAALLPCLNVGLNAQDEAFLEAALDDRRKEVRLAAAQLLASLPEAQFGRRSRLRAETMVSLEAASGQLTITLPDVLDKSAQRDGVGASARQGLGEKAGWLADVVAASFAWTERFQLAPAQIVAAAQQSDFADALLQGLCGATLRATAADDWFLALARVYLATNTRRHLQFPRNFLDAAVRLPAPAYERLVLDALATHTGMALLSELAAASPGPWTQAMSDALVAHLRVSVKDPLGGAWMPPNGLLAFAAVADPSAIDTYEQGWPTIVDHAWSQWDKPIGEFLRMLRFRHQMSQSFMNQSSQESA